MHTYIHCHPLSLRLCSPRAHRGFAGLSHQICIIITSCFRLVIACASHASSYVLNFRCAEPLRWYRRPGTMDTPAPEGGEQSSRAAPSISVCTHTMHPWIAPIANIHKCIRPSIHITRCAVLYHDLYPCLSLCTMTCLFIPHVQFILACTCIMVNGPTQTIVIIIIIIIMPQEITSM